MSQALRILIVEDEPRWTEAIKSNFMEILSDLGLPFIIDTPETIAKCREAIFSASERPYDLISLDINYREDGTDEPTDGLKLLRLIGRLKSAWLVSILTGVETDATVEDTYGTERARQLQEELRSRAYGSFPPDRLVVLEKPVSEDETMLANRLKQVCLILRQSLVGRNLFRPLRLTCQVACHRTVNGDLIKKDSKEFRRAKDAMEFVKEYENDSNASKDPKKRKQYARELEFDVLEKNGKKLPNAEWVEDLVSLRQVRYGCGEVITLPDSPNFETIQWLLRHPGKEFEAHQIGGESAEVGRLFEDFQHSAIGNCEVNGAEEDEREEDDYTDMNWDRHGEDRDFESNEMAGDTISKWDDTEALSRAVYKQDLTKKLAELENATGRRRNELESEIKALREAMGQVRKKAVGGKTHGLIKQHKSRTIAALREAGQVELANHLEKTIRNNGSKFWYDQEPGSIFWNVD
jgi:CheY-like chemotaxis protein